MINYELNKAWLLIINIIQTLNCENFITEANCLFFAIHVYKHVSVQLHVFAGLICNYSTFLLF